MWLLIDIGNSSSKLGLFDPTSGTETIPGEVISTLRLSHDAHHEKELKDFVGDEVIARVGAVSVVPRQSVIFSDRVKSLLATDVEFFDENSAMPVELTYETPETLGNDRIAAAVGGWNRYAERGTRGVIVIDAGTAINYEVVLAGGVYPGGIIAPGPGLARDALQSGTAQLPHVDLEAISAVIGRTTTGALQSGIMHGMFDSVTGMVRRICAETEAPMAVVLTGGWGRRILKQIDRDSGYNPDWEYDHDLVLKGITDLMCFAAERP